MNKDWQIKVGDLVHVNFNNAQTTLTSKAVVLSMPTCSGDSWVFEDVSTKQIIYVSEGCTITKLDNE